MSYKVLLVDDDKVILYLHKIMVERSSLPNNYRSFNNGKEILNFLNSEIHTATNYLVLLDLNMPVVDGWEVLDSCSKLNLSNVLFCIVSSSINKEDKQRAFHYEFVIDFIEKPLNQEKCNNLDRKMITQLKK